jgi:hypothetical protein
MRRLGPKNPLNDLNFKVTFFYSLGVLFNLLSMSSCSLFEERRPVGKAQSATISDNFNVPRAQYDEVINQLENERKESDLLKEKILRLEFEKENFKCENKETIEIIVPTSNEKNSIPIDQVKEEKKPKELNDEILSLEKAKDEMIKGRLAQAMIILKELSTSSNQHMRARSKFRIGEILVLQKEYELAQQVFQEIIDHYSFSSVSIDALREIIKCFQSQNNEEKVKEYGALLEKITGGQSL